MAVNITTCSRIFTSKTDSEDVARHGSPQYEDFQTLNDEDRELREKLFNDFSYYDKSLKDYSDHKKYLDRKGFGFDGEQLYSFIIEGSPTTIPHDLSRNVKYEVKVIVNKAGNSKVLKKPSDLELFLLEKKFKNGDSK